MGFTRNSICRCAESMVCKKTIAGMILAGLSISAAALAVEPTAPKPDPGQMATTATATLH